MQERELTPEEQREFASCADAGLRMLKLSEDLVAPEMVLEAIESHLDAWRKPKAGFFGRLFSAKPDSTQAAHALGSVWGNQIVRKFDWRWICSALLACAWPTAATEWLVVAEGSQLRFAGIAQGEAFDGEFKRFLPNIRFDPDALGDARFVVEVELASVDTQNSERDAALAEPDFFDSGQFPTAFYRAERFETAGTGFRALGELELRGTKRPVALEFQWRTTSEGAELVGRATIDRLEFAVGRGDWVDPETIEPLVLVNTKLRLKPSARSDVSAASGKSEKTETGATDTPR